MIFEYEYHINIIKYLCKDLIFKKDFLKKTSIFRAFFERLILF